MSSINSPLQRVLDDFAAGTLPGGTQSAEYQNLIAAVTASPVLNEMVCSDRPVIIRPSEQTISRCKGNLMKTFLFIPAALLLAACAAPQHTPKDKNMDTYNNSHIPGRPVLTPPEVLTKALDFMRAAKSPDDFNIDNAEKIMKIKFLKSQDPSNPIDFHISNEFGDTGWSWVFQFGKTEAGSGKMRVVISKGGLDIPATAVCQMDLDQFHPMLEQAGFTYTGKGNWGAAFKGYEKKYPDDYEADLKVFYIGESAEKVLHDCITGIEFLVYHYKAGASK